MLNGEITLLYEINGILRILGLVCPQFLYLNVRARRKISIKKPLVTLLRAVAKPANKRTGQL